MTLEKQKNFPLANITFKQPFNQKKVLELLQSNKISTDDRKLLKWLSTLKEPVANAKLKVPKSGWGRYCIPLTSIFKLSRKSRHYVCGEDYYDFDIVNSQPTMMLSYFKSVGLKNIMLLEKYVMNRNESLEQVMTEFQFEEGEYDGNHCSRKDISKKLFTSICNLGSFHSWISKYNVTYDETANVQYFKKLSDEMKSNIEQLKKIEIELWNDVKKMKKDEPEAYLEATFSSYLYQEMERRIIESILPENDEIESIYSLDGVMLPKKALDDNSVEVFCQAFHTRIMDVFGEHFNELKMINKPMDEAWVIEKADIEEEDSRKVCENDQEASDYLFYRLNNKLVYCDGVLYYKNGNYWISNKTELENVLLVLVLHSGIYKQDKKGGYVAYAQNVSSAKRIVEAIIARAYEKKDDSFYSKFHTSMKGKLCFNNGVFDFPTKTFTLWEDLKEEVFAKFGVTYDFDPSRNESVIQEVTDKVFKAIFGDDTEKALRSFSRGMAGHYTDKNWMMFQGNRDCGKGVLEGFFNGTFQNYVTSLSNDNFLYERNSGESEASKKWGWAMSLEFARICFTQESKTDNTNKNLKLDGTKIKGIASGGDNMKGRGLYENTRNFMVEALLVMCGNDFPPVSPADAMETCVTLSSTKQFKSESFIQERKEDKASQQELSCYVVADPNIKDKCSSAEWRSALMHILSDFYSSKLVERVNHFAEDSNEANPISKILNDFELSTNEKDKVSNEDLKEWSLEHNISLAKMKQILKSFKCKDYKIGSTRGLTGLRKKLVESEEENLPRNEKSL